MSRNKSTPQAANSQNKGFSKTGRNVKRFVRKRSKLRPRKKSFNIKIWTEKHFGPITQSIPLGVLKPLRVIKDHVKRRQYIKWYTMWRTKRYKRFLSRMPFYVRTVYGISESITVPSLVQHVHWFEELVYDKGPTYAVKLLKKVRDACLRFAANQTFERIDELKLHDDGLPLKVGHLMPLLTSPDTDHRRAAIQILDIVKLCEASGDTPDVTSITTPAPDSVGVIGPFIGDTLFAYGKTVVDQHTINKVVHCFRLVLARMFPQKGQQSRLNQLTSLSDIHMSVRKGPNGPAMGTIEDDYLGITQSGLIKPITKFAQITQNHELLLILDEMRDEINSTDYGSTRGPCLDSKLSIKYEAWGKTRFFAICDWFSQSTLKGLHKWIFRWLESQREDGTMSQDTVADIVRGWTAIELVIASNRVYSLDLSKATDRLPAAIQREIIQQMFGRDVADNWFTICTNRLFSRTDGEPVAFAVGQPLGVYSSWAMLALTHHVICRTAEMLSGIPRYKQEPHYVVIGDDVAIRGDNFAKWYTLIMSTILRVDISPTKGFTPKTCLGSNPISRVDTVSAEIAKRVFSDGKEISVVSPETLLSAMEYPADFPNLLRQLRFRGMDYDTKQPVAPITLASLGFNPDLACTLATFPLRPGVSEETLKAAYENSQGALNFIAWFQKEVVISTSELESMFRWSIRSTLLKTLNKFVDHYQVYLAVCRIPKRCGERVYHFLTRQYITQTLLNKSMLWIIELVAATDLLNFQGSGPMLDEIASSLNTMLDFEAALLGKPSSKRENLHRMRSRIISQLQPLVLQAIQKAKQNYGILLIDAGEQVELDPRHRLDLANHNLEARNLLRHETSKLVHDQVHTQTLERNERKILEKLARI